MAAGAYFNASENSTIRFRREASHYLISGDATPDTVALLPLASHPEIYVFQQSDGLGIAFYGAFRANSDHHGFRLFSPESVRPDALRAAARNGATLSDSGCLFTNSTALIAALVSLIANAPASSWNSYQPS